MTSMPRFARSPIFVFAMLAIGVATASGQSGDTTVHRPGNDVSLPRLVKEVKPTYTPEARIARIQGFIMLDAVVLSNGTVGDVKTLHQYLGRVGFPRRPADTKFGLDQQAVKALKQWLFEPGMKDGKPVAVRIAVELAFTPTDK